MCPYFVVLTCEISYKHTQTETKAENPGFGSWKNPGFRVSKMTGYPETRGLGAPGLHSLASLKYISLSTINNQLMLGPIYYDVFDSL